VKKKYVSRYHRQLAYPYPSRSFAHVFMVWGSSSRKEILYGVGRATDSIMGVCQYPGRCYHSEACMAGVGNDVTHLGTAPHWKHDLIAEPTCIAQISFIQTYKLLFSVNAHGVCCWTDSCVESKNSSNNKIIPNLKRSIDQSFRRISRSRRKF